MTDASAKLAQSRQAILEHIARRQRRHDPRMESAQGFDLGEDDPYPYADAEADTGGGRFSGIARAVRTWWHHHPAHMAVELVAPALHEYARRKPGQLLGISVAAGAAVMFARPWRLISLTTLALALVKSSHLPSLLMAALSAADFKKDNDRP